MIDDRSMDFPVSDKEFMIRIAARRTGIGCDGIILLQPSDVADLRMRFFNPDGGEQNMCGNGARCFARLAHDLRAAPTNMKIETAAGIVNAGVQEDRVRINLTNPSDWRLGLDAGLRWPVDFVNTGVPHALVRVDDLAKIDLPMLGRRLRYHDLFAPEGTNANFIKVEADATLSIRTYERGVEAETLACGTGAAAAALISERNGWVKLPVAVHCVGGYDLMIDSSDGQVALWGGAEYVFEGMVDYGNWI